MPFCFPSHAAAEEPCIAGRYKLHIKLMKNMTFRKNAGLWAPDLPNTHGETKSWEGWSGSRRREKGKRLPKTGTITREAWIPDHAGLSRSTGLVRVGQLRDQSAVSGFHHSLSAGLTEPCLPRWSKGLFKNPLPSSSLSGEICLESSPHSLPPTPLPPPPWRRGMPLAVCAFC